MASNNTATYQMFNSVVKMLSDKKITSYLCDRPKETPAKMSEFAVVDFPVDLYRPYVGNDDYRYTTTCVIYLFVRAKNDGTPNIDKQSSLVRGICEAFPYKDSVCECVNPVVRLRGSDDYGFQFTTITFTLRTKINSITNIQ